MNNLHIKIKMVKQSYKPQLVTLILAAGAIALGFFMSTTFIIAGVLLFLLFSFNLYQSYKINQEFDLIEKNAMSNRNEAIKQVNKLISEYSEKQARKELKAKTSTRDRNDSLKDAIRYQTKVKYLLEIKDILDGDSFE